VYKLIDFQYKLKKPIMKKHIFITFKVLLIGLIFKNITIGQIGINGIGAAPATNSMLDISSTTKGLLIPRMTTAQRTILTATATDGLTVYDTDTKSFWFYNSTAWTPLSTGNNWINAGDDIYNGNTGNIGIGVNNPTSKLDIRGDFFLQTGFGSLKLGYPGSNQWKFNSLNGGQQLLLLSSPTGSTYTERVMFDNNGNVGIGTVPGIPLGKLHLQSVGSTSGTTSDVDPFLRMKLTNNANYGWTRFENADGSKHFSQRYDLFSSAATNTSSLFYGANQLFTITGDGRFGMNINAPLDLLHLGPIAATGDVYARISSTTGLTGLRLQNNTGDWSIYSNEFSKLFIGYSADNFSTNNQVIIVEPNVADYNFKPSTTNQVLLGTAANRWKETNTVALDVSGNANVTGEINRNQTGASNMVPIAYGTINAAGGVELGTSSGNVTCTKIGTGFYDIGIAGESYHFQLYTAICTIIDSVNPKFIGTGSGSGLMHVRTYNSAGAPEDNPFGFVIYKK
jgi:hypothetical protein